MLQLKSHAVRTALEGDWKTAISLNRQLLRENPNDIEALNRLAYAFSVIDKIKDAKSTYRLVLKIDTQNPIALRNLKRLTERGSKNGNSKTKTLLALSHRQAGGGQVDTMFLEETGKTKVIELVNVAEPKIISFLMTGEILALSIKRLKIFVLDKKNQYIGMLPDDIAKRLIRFLKGGNIYQASVKSIENHHLAIFVKEVKRASRFKNQPSFTLFSKSKSAGKSSTKHYSMVSRLEDLEESVEESSEE